MVYLDDMFKVALISLAALMTPAVAGAECYVDYKAKRDDPLQLHYGVIGLPDSVCGSRRDIERFLDDTLREDDWTLLAVVSVLEEDELQERKKLAGDFFLKY